MKFKDLLQIAKNELQDLSTVEDPDFRLEQAEFNKDGNYWDIVVSYLVENNNIQNSNLASISSVFKFDRIYKSLKIDENKNVLGLYMYETD